MLNLQKFHNIYKQYNEFANFAIIYLVEAHASDSLWPMQGIANKIETARNINDRVNALKFMIEEWKETVNNDNEFDKMLNDNKMEFLIDDMNDIMNKKFVAFPERVYVIENYKVIFQGEMGPDDYNLDEVEAFLRDHCK